MRAEGKIKDRVVVVVVEWSFFFFFRLFMGRGRWLILRAPLPLPRRLVVAADRAGRNEAIKQLHEQRGLPSPLVHGGSAVRKSSRRADVAPPIDRRQRSARRKISSVQPKKNKTNLNLIDGDALSSALHDRLTDHQRLQNPVEKENEESALSPCCDPSPLPCHLGSLLRTYPSFL